MRDFLPGSVSGLTAFDDRLVFVADDGVHGFELWESDGTAAGTRLAQDIAPGPASSPPAQLTVAGDRLYFAADDGLHGTELWALPRAWSASTNGVVRGAPVKVKLETNEDLDKNKGKLSGKFVLLGDPAEIKPHDKAQFQRYDEKSLADLGMYEIPGSRPPRFTREELLRRRAFNKALIPFLAEEKPLAVIVPGSGDYGTFHVQSAGSFRDGEGYPVPSVVLSDEQYGRIVRLLNEGKTPELELEVRAHDPPLAGAHHLSEGSRDDILHALHPRPPARQVVGIADQLPQILGRCGDRPGGAGLRHGREA